MEGEPSVDVETAEEDSRITRLFADVDGAPRTADIWVPCLNDVRLIDVHLGVDVGRVDPVARKVLRQVAAWSHRLRFHCVARQCVRYLFA